MEYDISKYTDSELYNILDLHPFPTDRELEAKIIQLIRRYDAIGNSSANELSDFFKKVYKHFFDIEDENETEEHDNLLIKTESQSNDNVTTIHSQSSREPFTTKIKESLENKQPDDTPNQLTNPSNTSNPTYTTTLNYTPGLLNPLLKETITRVISIDSQYRNKQLYRLPTNFTVYLSETLRDVVSISLYSYQIPYQWFTISSSYGANFFYLKGNSPGIDNGLHDYQIQIKMANYTGPQIIEALNTAMQNLATTYTDTNFSNTGIKFVDPNTNLRSQITIDIQKIYNETYYQLQWSSSTNPELPTSISNNSIPSYLGYTKNIYIPNKIVSITPSFNILDSDTILVDNTNNTINIIQYIGPNDYDYYQTNNIDTSYNTIPITITNGIRTRKEIVDEINSQLLSNTFTNSALTVVNNQPNSLYNFAYDIYYLTINFNRYTQQNKINAKTIIQFPIETHNDKLWTGTTSFFKFDASFNEMNNIISENAGLKSNYNIGNGVKIILRCINPKYQNANKRDVNDASISINDYKIQIAPSGINGYSLQQYLSAIYDGFNTCKFTATVNNNTVVTDLSGEFFLAKRANPNNTTILIANSRLNMHFYIRKHFPQTLYSMNIKGSFLNTLFNIGGSDIATSISLQNTNIFISSIDISNLTNYDISSTLEYNSIYYYDTWLAFTLSDDYSNIETNGTPKPFYMLQMTNINPSGSTLYSNYTTLANNINTAFQSYYSENQYPLKNSSISIVPDPDIPAQLNITLTIIIDTILTENDYAVEFIDTNSPISWIEYLSAITPTTSSYNISTLPNGTLIGYNNIKDNILQIVTGINDVFYIKPIVNTIGGAYASNNINDLSFTVPPGNYTKTQLVDQINMFLSQTQITIGSMMSIYTDPETQNQYTILRLNINKIYTSADYKLVFYDPVSFFRCFNNANSGQNVTVDNTLGWIIGFRDYTEYVLSSENLQYNSDDPTNTYYNTSTTGKYTYSSTNSNISIYNPNTVTSSYGTQLNTKTIINITSDTPVNVYIYSYFLISLNDYVLNDMNDGMIHITNTDNTIQNISYANLSTTVCNPVTNKPMITDSNNNPNYMNLTQKQIYALNQAKQNAIHDPTLPRYSVGPEIHDLFGIIPLKLSGLQYGQLITDYGGSLQAQTRTYFGPVNISKLSISLLTDKGDYVDLQGSNWAFSLLIETLYKANQK